MPAEYLLLESGDHLLLEDGDDLLLESSTVDLSIDLPCIDDSAIYAPVVSQSGVVPLPCIDDGGTFPPDVFEDKTLELPIVDDSAVYAPGVAVGSTLDLPCIDDSAIYAPSAFVDQLISLPFIADDSAVYAPSFVTDESLFLPLIDGGWAFGPLVGGTTAGLELYVGGTLVADCFARSFEVQIADTGSFSFQMLRLDFTLSGIAFDDLVSYRIDGLPVFLGVVEQIDHNALSQGEEADQTVTISGRGALGLFDQHVVYPSRGVDTLPIEEVRSFSWVSPDFIDTLWAFAKKVNRQREYADWRSPVPWIWPDTTGYWIWANLPSVNALYAPSGVCLFRKSFTLAAETVVRVFAAADNHLRLWIDGAEMASFSSFTTGEYVEITLSAGTHYIAAKVNNDIKATLPNPGGFICAVYSVGDGGLLDELITHTDATWRCLPYPVVAPGYTYGEVIRLLLEEAGIDGDWTLDFTDTLDSSGTPWPERREIQVTVGRSLLEVFREFTDTHVDLMVAPGSQTLRAWVKDGWGTTRPATLQQTTDPDTSDFLSLRHSGKRTRLNTALLRYADGHTEVVDAASVASYGTRGGYVEIGAVGSKEEAQSIAEALMVNRAEPAYATEATIHPRATSTTPFKGFDLADWVTCPDETDAAVSMRVLSIALSEDDEGVLDWPIRLRDEQLEMEERFTNWLRRMADGASYGGARVASPAGTPAPTAQQITALDVAEFSTHTQGAALPTGYGIARRAAKSGNGVEIAATITLDTSDTPTSTATVFKVWHSSEGGAWVQLGSTVTVPAGATEAEVPLDLEPIKANVDRLRPEIVTAGAGAEGLDIQVRAI